MERRKLLVTGCGRSGTLYASQVWQTQGLDITHENPRPPNGKMGRDGIASWYMAVNDTDPPYGPSAADYEFDFVIHQVRHPLKAIASAAFVIFRLPRECDYVERNAPETRLTIEEKSLSVEKQLLLRASRYWYYWNLISQARANLTIQVELLTASLEGLCKQLGVAYVPGVADRISKNTHSRELYTKEAYSDAEWREIEALDPDLARRIRKLATDYGYAC